MSEFEFEKHTGEYPLVAREIRSNTIHKEVTADYVLPDYMGDVKRVLKYNAFVTPCNKLVSRDEASFIAMVTFKVKYLNSEDLLTEAIFTADLEVSEKLFGESADANMNYKVQAVTLRLGGPRKITAKASVLCDFCAVEEKKICECAEYTGAEILKKSISIHTAEYLKCAEREYAEEMDKINEAVSDDFEVIEGAALAFIDGVHKTEGGLNLSGYIDAFCILRGDEGIVRLERRIPIEERVECELYDNSVFLPVIHVTGASVNLNNVNNDDSCFVSVVMNMTVDCSLEHHYNQKIDIMRDAFYVGCDNKCSYESFEFSRLGDCLFEKASLSANMLRSDEALHDVIESEMNIKNVRYERTGTDLTVMCESEIHIIARGNGREDFYSIKENVDFSKKFKLSMCENSKINICATPCDVSVSFDAEKIYIEAQILISVITETRECEKMLTAIQYERTNESDERSVVVYYPEKDDTLWSVSKKYAVSPSAVASKNSITGESLSECKKIIIVK